MTGVQTCALPISSGIVENVTTSVNKELAKETSTSKLAGGAEVDGFNCSDSCKNNLLPLPTILRLFF